MKNDCTSQATNCHKFRGLRTRLTYYLIVFSRSKPKPCIVQHPSRLKSWWPLDCAFNLGPSSKHTQVIDWIQSLLRSKSLVFLPAVGQQSISSPRTCSQNMTVHFKTSRRLCLILPISSFWEVQILRRMPKLGSTQHCNFTFDKLQVN